MAYRALDVANYVVHHALETGKPITHLQLQKILYYLEAVSLVKNGESLINDDIEKWKLGPVVPEVYHQYKVFGSNPISYVPKELKISDDNIFDVELKEFQEDVIHEETRKEINPLIDKLLNYSGFQLVEMTHQHDLWKDDAPKIQEGIQYIKYNKNDMREYFIKNKDELGFLLNE